MSKKQTEATTETTGEANFTLTYRREHPQNRCSYGIPGNPGIVVFDRGLFADPAFNGPIMLDVQMAAPKATVNVDKVAAAAEKAAQKAEAAAAKLKVQQEKAAARQEKADKALAAAKAKVDAAAAAKPTAVSDIADA